MENKINISFIKEEKSIEIDIQQPDLSNLVHKIIAEHLLVSETNIEISTDNDNFDKEEFLQMLIEVHQDFCEEIDKFYKNIDKEIRTYYEDEELSKHIIEKIKEIVGTSPAILTGDFNVSEDWDAYKTITNNEFILKDAHKVAGKRTGVDFTYHNFGKIPAEKCEKIDFIFVTPQIRVISSYIPFSQLNDTLFLSDHNPEIVELEIK